MMEKLNKVSLDMHEVLIVVLKKKSIVEHDSMLTDNLLLAFQVSLLRLF